MSKQFEQWGMKASVRSNQLPSAVESSLAPNPVRGRATGCAMFSPQAWEQIARSLKLSGRELQLMHGVFDGKKECAVASALGVSSHTIHTHAERLHQKLGVTDRCQLVQRVMLEFLPLTVSPKNVLSPICVHRETGGCPGRSGLAATNRSAAMEIRFTANSNPDLSAAASMGSALKNKITTTNKHIQAPRLNRKDNNESNPL